jgi:hypothetical protein
LKHFASSTFWKAYDQLPGEIQKLADKNFALLKVNPFHSSLRFKRIGDIWSVRVGLHYRALATEIDGGMLWFWIGSHASYDKLLE